MNVKIVKRKLRLLNRP